MSIPTLTIITGLPNSGQEEYLDNMNISLFDKYVIPAIPQICEDLRKGKNVALWHLDYIKYDKRKEFMSEIIAKMDHPDSVRFDIVICVKSYSLLSDDDFKLLCDFEFPIKEEGFENIIIEKHNPNNQYDNILYNWRSNLKISEAMKKCGYGIGCASGAGIYNIGTLGRVVYCYDTKYIGNFGAYIVAANVDSIKLAPDPKEDYNQKLNMIFIINYQNYGYRYKLDELITRFGPYKFKMIMTIDTIITLMNQEENHFI